ncbi:hypothetical protein AB672_09530 [Xylella taiwanensis]|nr:hypothetical protein AB672_09530 [Xylella taiwanensis]
MSIELLILAKHLSSEHFKTCSTTIDKVVIIILMKFCHYITDIRVLGHANKPLVSKTFTIRNKKRCEALGIALINKILI